MSLYNRMVRVRAAITTQRLTCQRCGREIEVPLDCDHRPCPFCQEELGICTGDAATTSRIRRHYAGCTVTERLTRPLAATLLAYTSEGYLITYEGAPYWMHATAFYDGTSLQRLDAWRAEHEQPNSEDD